MSIDPGDLAAEATEPADDGHEVTAVPISGELVHAPERSALRPQHEGSRQIAGSNLPVVPGDHEIATLAQMAVTISGAATAPRALQGNPNDAFMVLLTARDVGVGLTTAVREFHVIDGKVTLSPKVKLAMVHQQGAGNVYPHQPPREVVVGDEPRRVLCPCGSDEPGNDDERATWHAERADQPGIVHSSTFTMDMARRVRAKENGKAITLAEKSTWQQYPQRMLSWRALGYLLDDVFPEVGTGLYSPDELGAVTDADGVPVIDVMGSAEPVRGTRAPRGRRSAAQQAQEDPPASDEQKQALTDRIGVLGKVPAARQALIALWTKPRSDDDRTPTLPPLNRLHARQVKTAEAMVASIEARAAKGEWGPWPPEPPADGQEGSDSAADPSEAADGDPGPESGDVDGTDDPTEAVIGWVKSLELPAVRDELDKRQLVKSGAGDVIRRRLAEALLAEAAAS